MAGLLSKGITLSYKGDNGKFVTLPNLQEIAEIGNNAPEKIDVTTLSDDTKKSIAGLADTAQDLPFKFLYEKAEFEAVIALNGSKMWLVTLPDGMKAYFNATPSVKIAGAGVSAPVTYTLMLSVESKIEWGEPPTDDVTFTLPENTLLGIDESGTFTVANGTTWAEFVATGASVGEGELIIGSGDGNFEDAIGYSKNGGITLAKDGVRVSQSEVIEATTYEWIE